MPPPPISSPKHYARQSLPYNSREANVILFGLPETKSIVESKIIVDEIFEFLAGKKTFFDWENLHRLLLVLDLF